MKTRLLLFVWLLAAVAPAVAERPAGFLFVTFGGQGGHLSEQVYFATSEDGRNWTALNDQQPVLVSEIGERGVRDPTLIRRPDGEGFYLIATDLSMHYLRDWGKAVREGSHNIVVWESDDLVEWSEPRLCRVAPDDAGCTWAPEAFFDEEEGDYLVFWASTTGRDDFQKHRIWAVRTKDFREFSEPFIYIEKPTTVIDTTIVRDGDTYYRFTKDEKHKAITMERAERIAGPWSDVPGFTLAKLRGYEGPACYQIEPAEGDKPPVWGLILDNYARGRGYIPWVTRDLASGEFEEAEGFNFPFHLRHGSVEPLSADELARVRAAYGKE